MMSKLSSEKMLKEIKLKQCYGEGRYRPQGMDRSGLQDTIST